MTLTLRYYAPNYSEQLHAEILRLLDDVQRTHQIPHEIRELARRPGHQPGTWVVDDSGQEEIYQRDFRRRADGVSPDVVHIKALRVPSSNRGL